MKTLNLCYNFLRQVYALYYVSFCYDKNCFIDEIQTIAANFVAFRRRFENFDAFANLRSARLVGDEALDQIHPRIQGQLFAAHEHPADTSLCGYTKQNDEQRRKQTE